MEKDVNNTGKSQSALREEEVLKFWKENKIFEKSLEKDAPKGEYVFYEGPPTANGKPGIHHLEARAFKDVIPRYKTMQGFHVRRKGGWDTHGLPVELQVEKKLGLISKKAIEEYGIAQFNKECKESVWEYTDLWEKFTERMGYWVDQKNAYVTYHNDYIESVWNVIKTVNEKGLLYKDYKVVPWCPRCGTTLSSHELAQGYQDVKDLSVYAKFKVKGQDNTYILAWTTTPWTLPGNVALAVGKDIEYIKSTIPDNFNPADFGLGDFNVSSGTYIYARENALKDNSKDNYLHKLDWLAGMNHIKSEIVKGSNLVGLEYDPLYPYLSNTISDIEKPKLEKAFKVYSADFVTTEDGTGVVHTAVMYGVDDFNLGTSIGLPKHHMVGLDGKFLEGADFLTGRFVRDEEVAVDIIKDLAHRGLLFKKEKYEHSYPHCWRCKTALIYYARDSWYIKMSDPKIKKELIEENKSINWEPSYIKEGRFGEWLKDIKDWAISRERYWGTPLPIWTCAECNKREVIGSIADLKSKTKKSGNKYWVMRHGQAECNTSETVMNDEEANNCKLTKVGVEQVIESSKNFKEKVDVIIASPLERTRETTKIICEQIGYPLEKVIYNDLEKEWDVSSDYQGKSREAFEEFYCNQYKEHPFEAMPNGESYSQVINRVGKMIYEIDSKYSGKNILLVGHAGETSALCHVVQGFSYETLPTDDNFPPYLKNAEIRKLDFVVLPHNENFELDLHKPYIDEVELVCDCGGKLERSKEVMDVWLDSGTMPFSQDHYPFDPEGKITSNGAGNKEQKILYPADFISEALDQTRGWFYTLHAVGVLMGKGKAYKNVICLGLLLDGNGKKMSKSLGNVVDPWVMMDKYGVDTLRLWMYGVNQPGEAKSFDEKTVAELHSKVFNLLYNVLAFYELYRDKEVESSKEKIESKNVLDQWIIARMSELTDTITKNMENYKLLEPVRAIRDFMDDLSTWYVRRSRERLKDGDIEAKQTLYFILKTLVTLMAPFAPFASEDIWQKLKNEEDKESVHLTKWSNSQLPITNYQLLISEMQKAREIVTLGLQARQKESIPVRQPLGQLLITNYQLPKEYLEIIKDELNVKDIVLESDGEELKVELDIHITEELKQEGNYRELVRAIQDMRKKAGLNPNDIIGLEIETSVDGQDLITKFKTELLKAVGAKEIKIKENSGVEVKIDVLVFTVNLVK
ncbi:TPA: isoleucine--tRNA ligase [Candidatus Nomurabacteria bacterium]|uniref:Isoleucine--tRNA ligase n=1 Tax=Candidatus Nomurabacteria bacterium GW2011_GWE1_35_16 TaxID=1618761 RepID=A0A0G0DV46_9BACT|nr:MAG: Isoleucine-tRNA ligase [Candidatus Nomurabacteria bacterium GW2011_GWF1_34_20]KKP63688.1 MAG: Isoleucine-tRNA ligase [Candidatus Nomurabacteria bacterium GW2011_GWE2_34_25]KKP66890.1 MAG: Isoleucine-tRNA ligase [Candidatus Nomurabacteria bacterium GW2011_GWE1_35_16]KKP83516.1 MAG: Isoleucine-tRNA ligase [Candidatus Nomurabacteria bacterium GW2011_GWF2_35_66]HAE36552.1 isoleucine--tRNA ligase [Candidatus Nomurabacteria bacterium]